MKKPIISEEKLEYFKIKIDEVGRLLNGYISFNQLIQPIN
jgi:hypothetical protein